MGWCSHSAQIVLSAASNSSARLRRIYGEYGIPVHIQNPLQGRQESIDANRCYRQPLCERRFHLNAVPLGQNAQPLFGLFLPQSAAK
jgi:hypothetical protein